MGHGGETVTGSVDVAWLSLVEGIPNRHKYWDQGIVEDLLAGRIWEPSGWPAFAHHDTLDTVPDGHGAVVIVPARSHSETVEHRSYAPDITAAIARLPWVLLILTGDEEGSMRPGEITHPRMVTWVQTPHPATTHPPGTRFLPCGPGKFVAEHLQTLAQEPKTLEWFYAGQSTNDRRHGCAAALRAISDPPGRLVETASFTGGLDPSEYAQLMAQARVAPCPSGPYSPDTFRFAEAMDAGCVPIVDETASRRGVPGYWPMLFGSTENFVVVEDWADGQWRINDTLADWEARAGRAGAWWMGYRRSLATNLIDDLASLSGDRAEPTTPDGMITVIMTTSPIPSHPDTGIIEQTIASIRAQLPAAEIIIACDGIREEQEHMRPAYEEYVRRLTRLCRHEYKNALPIVMCKHVHQANATREALEHVRTPQVLFVEHDTPIVGDIDWPGLTRAIKSGDAGVIRLGHWDYVHQSHRHLTLGGVSIVNGVPLVPTAQWSQRPHLTTTETYRRIVALFPAESRTMIEDHMHGILEDGYNREGIRDWEKWRLYLYAPSETTTHGMRRSTHLDGRAGHPKYEMTLGD